MCKKWVTCKEKIGVCSLNLLLFRILLTVTIVESRAIADFWMVFLALTNCGYKVLFYSVDSVQCLYDLLNFSY